MSKNDTPGLGTGSLKDQLRRLKSLAGPFEKFDVENAPNGPAELFGVWLQSAVRRGIAEAHAMTLSTVDDEGPPDARVLILKNVDSNGWHFASSKLSPKGRQIALNPNAALTFYWQPLGRQVRLRGKVLEQSSEVSKSDFLARPVSARTAALLGRQSDIFDREDMFDAGLVEQRLSIESDPSLVSPTWAVYALKPTEVEFWQADAQRIHTRLRYRRISGGLGWAKEQLWP